MRGFQTYPAGAGIPQNSDSVFAAVLAANTAKQYTVPAGAGFVFFSANCDFYAAYGSNPTAAVPAADVTDGSASEVNPTGRWIAGGVKISLISPQGGVVTMAFYGS